MQFHGVVAAAAHNDFLALVAAETSDDDPIGGIAGQGPAAAGAEVRLHDLDRPRPFDAQRGHGSATGRSELDDLRRLGVVHVSRRAEPEFLPFQHKT